MKKVLLISLIIMTFVFGVTTYADDVKYGDVDFNGYVDASDAMLVLKHSAKLSTIEGDALVAADVSGEGAIDASDALEILKYAAKLIDSFTVEDKVQVTEEPTPEVTEKPVMTPRPTREPVNIEVPTWPTMIPLPEVSADPANYVEGVDVELASLNGATEENGIYTFTADNTTNRMGISFKNPFAGKKELVESFTDAFAGQVIELTDLQKEVYDATATYPEPKWNTGVSLSFWAKYEWDNVNVANDDPILVFHRSNRDSKDFAVSLSLNGTVRFEEGEDAHNSFRADGATCGKANDWNYYTITIKNDWITVYVNGQECAYHKVALSKEAIGLFNGGYMTKYNVIDNVTEEQLANDIRGYYKSSGMLSGGNIGLEATRIDNGTYQNAGYHSGAALLMECMVNSEAELVIGGTTTFKATGNIGNTAYSLDAGTQAAGVKAYYTELTPEQVAANYAAEASKFIVE